MRRPNLFLLRETPFSKTEAFKMLLSAHPSLSSEQLEVELSQSVSLPGRKCSSFTFCNFFDVLLSDIILSIRDCLVPESCRFEFANHLCECTAESIVLIENGSLRWSQAKSEIEVRLASPEMYFVSDPVFDFLEVPGNARGLANLVYARLCDLLTKAATVLENDISETNPVF